MKNRAALVLLLILVTATGTYFLLRTPSERERIPGTKVDKLRVQLQWFPQAQFTGLYVAKQKEFFRDENLDVQLMAGGPGINPIDVVLAGRADIGLMTADQLMLRAAANAPLRVIGSVFERSTAGLAFRDTTMTATRLKNLQSMSAYVYDDFDTGLILQILEKREGFQTVHKFPGVLGPVDLFRSKAADIFGVYVFNEPVTLQSQHIPFAVLTPDELGIAYYSDAFFTTSQKLAADRSVAQRFLRAAARGWAFAQQEPDEAIRSMFRLVPTLPQADSTIERLKLKAITSPRGATSRSYLGTAADSVLFGMSSTTWRAMCSGLKSIGRLATIDCATLESQLIDYSFTPVSARQ